MANQTSSRAIDVVGIFDTGFNQKFFRARPLKATVKETAKVMDHPLESGVVVSDHKIINPIEIELPLVTQSFDYQSVYEQIRKSFLSSELLLIQTKTGVYRNMIISDLPHEEGSEMFDQIAIAMKLREVKIVSSKSRYSPRRASQRSTSKNGEQKPKPTSYAKQIADKTGNLFRSAVQ